MISSQIDYCNSLLYGVNKYNVAKLQKIQITLCRLVFRIDKTSHVTSYLQNLHWLSISYCILLNYNLVTFKAIKFSQPTYLSSLKNPVALLVEIGFLFLQFIPRRPLVGKVLQLLLPQTPTISPITEHSNWVSKPVKDLLV